MAEEMIICPYTKGDCFHPWRGCEECSIKWDADIKESSEGYDDALEQIDTLNPDEPLGLGV